MLTARWRTPGSSGSRLGTAKETSTPSCSKRTSWWSRRAWCCWMVNRRPGSRAATSVNPAGCASLGSPFGSASAGPPRPRSLGRVRLGRAALGGGCGQPVAPVPASATLPVGAPSTGGGGSGCPPAGGAGCSRRGGCGVPDGSGVRWKSRLAAYSSRLARPVGRAVALRREPGAAPFAGRVGGAGGEPQRLHGRGQRLLVVQDRAEPVAGGEPLPDVVDPEVARLQVVVQLVPVQRGRHRRPGQRPQRVDAGDVGPGPVHLVVDEHLARPFRDRPGHGRLLRVGADDQPAHPLHELAGVAVGVGAVEGHEHLHAGRPRGLGVAPQAEPVQHHLDQLGHGADVLVGVRLEGVEVEEGVVGPVQGAGPRVQGVHLDAAEVDHVQQAGQVLGEHELDDPGVLLGGHGRGGQPVGGVGRHLLLVERLAGQAVRHPLHGQRPVVEVGEEQLGHVPVVGEQVALGDAVVRPVDLVQVGQAQLTAVGLQPPGVAGPRGRAAPTETAGGGAWR